MLSGDLHRIAFNYDQLHCSVSQCESNQLLLNVANRVLDPCFCFFPAVFLSTYFTVSNNRIAANFGGGQNQNKIEKSNRNSLFVDSIEAIHVDQKAKSIRFIVRFVNICNKN